MLSMPPLIGQSVSLAANAPTGEGNGEAGEGSLHHSRVTCAETHTQVPFRFCQSSV